MRNMSSANSFDSEGKPKFKKKHKTLISTTGNTKVDSMSRKKKRIVKYGSTSGRKAEEHEEDDNCTPSSQVSKANRRDLMPVRCKPFREIDLERILYRWYERRNDDDGNESPSSSSPPPTIEEIMKKALNLTKKMGGSEDFLKSLNKDWIENWLHRYGVKLGVVDEVNEAGKIDDKVEQKVKDERLDKDEEDVRDVLNDEYSGDQIYCGFAFQFDWTSLPDKTLDVQQSEDRGVWLLMAGNKSGRHRTRLLITGKQWRPTCLKNVNMLSQPVVYAGGGVGVLTPDLFTWWFHREFAPAALALNERGAVLVMEHADFLPASGDCVAADGKVKLVVYRRHDPGIMYPDQSLIAAELRTRYAMLLLHNISIEQQRWVSVTQYIATFTLKDAFPMLHRAWLNIRPETFHRCWTSTLHAFDDVTSTPLTFGRSAATALQVEEDRMLLLELQWLSHDLGLEVTDEDLARWVSCVADTVATDEVYIKPEPAEENGDPCSTVNDNSSAVPSAAEAAACLQKVLSWMESEPLDPNLVLIVRDVMTMAKQASKMGLGPTHPGTGLPFFCHNGDHLTQPPPAHMGIPPYQLDPKGAGEYWRSLAVRAPSHSDWKRLLAASSGLTRPPMYPFTTGQYPYPMLSPEMSQVAASWHTPSMYPISTASAGFRSPYPTSLPLPSSSLPSDLYRFSPSGLMASHPGLSPHSHPSLASHPAIVTPGPKQDLSQATDHNHRSSSLDHKNSSAANDSSKTQDSGHTSNNQDKKKPHIKKPLNAFMLYMKEMRAKVVAECTLKESAAINQILGRRWHSLTREEQAKYYEKARQERQLHMELYPGWSARDNYGYGAKKKKRKKERVPISDSGGNSMKKCRARYGLDQQSQWCKPCRRKKKCIRYMECGDDGNQSEDNLGSCGSVGEAQTPPEDDGESFHQSMSSPGGLSGLSSLTSPSMILPSPSASLASPSVSLASPCMSLQSPLTPHALDFDCVGQNKSIVPPPVPPPPPCLPLLINHQLAVVQPHRNPVGTNPHDINNPLSVNQLTGKCIKNSSSPNAGSSSATSSSKDSSSSSRPVISVT